MGIFFGGQIPEKVFMFGKIVFVAYLFGITRDMDAYLVAMTIPTLYTNLLADTVYIYMLDLFTQHISDTKKAWEITNIIVTLTMLIGALFAGGYALAMPALKAGLGQGMDVTTVELSARLAVLFAPLFLVYLLQAIFKACSEAFQLFGVSSLQSSITNFSAIVILVIMSAAGKPGIIGYVAATIISEFAGALCYVPQLVKRGFRYRPDFRFGHPDVKKHYMYAATLALGSGVYKFYIPINRYFLLFLPVGAISAFNYATNLVQVFSSLLRAFVNAVFPSLTIASHGEDRGEVRRFMEMALRAMALVGIPLTVMVVMLRAPILSMLQRGKFTEDAMRVAAGSTGFLAPCLLFFPLIYLQIRMLTVLRRMRALVIIGAAGMGLIALLDKIILSYVMPLETLPYGLNVRDAGVYAISFGNTVAMFAMSAAAMQQIWKAIGVINSRIVGLAVWKGCAAAAAGACAISAAGFVVERVLPVSSFAKYAIILLGGGAAGAAAALAAMVALRTQEINDAFSMIRKKTGSRA